MKINIRMFKYYIRSSMTCITKEINIFLFEYHVDFLFDNFCHALYNCIY